MAPSSTVKMKYDAAGNRLQTTLGLWLDEVKLKMTVTEKALKEVNNVLDDIDIGVERPGHFMMEHHLHKKHTRLQFHSSAKVQELPVKLTLVHHIGGPGVTTLEGTSTILDHSKLTVKHTFSRPGPIVKYEFHQGPNAIEPQLDFGQGGKDSWAVSLKHGHGKKEFVKGTYFHRTKVVELELHKKIDSDGGPLKITAFMDLNDIKKIPRVVFEKEWAM